MVTDLIERQDKTKKEYAAAIKMGKTMKKKIAKCLQDQGENRYLVLAKPRHQWTKSANECDERHDVYDQVPFC